MTDALSVRPIVLSVVVPWKDDPRVLGLLNSLKGDEASSDCLELVLVNDATENTELIGRVEQLVASLPNARIVESSFACVGAARNAGLRESSAAFVCFSDSDDEPQWRALIAMAQQSHEADLDVLIGDYEVVWDGSSTTVRIASSERRLSPMASALGDVGAVWRYVFRKDFLVRSDIQFPDWNYAEDVVFLLSVLAARPRQGLYSEVAYVYCEHASGRRLTKAQRATGEFKQSTERLAAMSTDGLDLEMAAVAELWRARIWAHALRTLPLRDKWKFLCTAQPPRLTSLRRGTQLKFTRQTMTSS